MATNNQVADTQRYLDNDARPPMEAQAPSTTPQAYEANTENLSVPMAGTVLRSETFNISDSGVQKVNEYSHNTSNQAELRAKLEQQRVRTTGRSIYQTAPTSGGFEPWVDVSEPVKPTEKDLTQLRKLETLRTINNKVRSLKLDEQRLSIKLSNIRNSIKTFITEAEALTTSKTES